MKINTSRRDFLKLFGYSVASAAVLAACKRPVQLAVPYANQPPEITPGKAVYYASTYFDGQEYCSILVKTRDGRPIKIEGNALSSFNTGGTSARVQASVLSLYDDSRLRFPSENNKKTPWEIIDTNITADLSRINASGRMIVLLTPTIISPTTTALINKFGKSLKNFRWIQYDPVSYSAITSANRTCFGTGVIPDYRFDKADLILSVNADFLGTWIAPVRFIPRYASGRRLNDGKKEMLKHVHYETGLSVTGANADVRRKIKPSEEKSFFISLYNRVIKETRSGQQLPGVPFRDDLSALAGSLLHSRGRSIVISGSHDTETQVIVNAINNELGNYGECIELAGHLRVGSGIDSEMEQLIGDMNNGKVGALLMYDVNPAYDSFSPGMFTEGLKKIEIAINMTTALNETTGLSKYECPVNHFLESWNDFEIIPGMMSIAQPCINLLFDTRSFQDSLLKWSGENISWHDYLRSAWEREYFPLSGGKNFNNFWEASVSSGVFNYKSGTAGVFRFDSNALSNISSQGKDSSLGEYEVQLYTNVSIGDGKQSNNPWLMELPDPLTRQCWENVACLSPKDASTLGIVTGQMIKLNDELIIPALVQKGQTEGTISIALGYGHVNSGFVANGKGVNMFPLTTMVRGNRQYCFSIKTPVVMAEIVSLGLVQYHDSMEGREIVRNTMLSSFRMNPVSGNEKHLEFETLHKSLYPERQYDGFHWGIAIDLNACVGCGACVIACQAENNSPTVGKDQVARNRIMQWIRIHRYYSDDADNPRVYFQPVFCQHCDNAPCENVCPVSATNHSNEGLNQMAYNRCVGTKYCMNNCPYRVRRFNWYRYTNNREFNYNTASELGRMVLNPDVTVRERGVVEKCSFCVQRIQSAKLEAKLGNRVLKDGEIKTACMQACPAGAIIFGNLNDRESAVSVLFSQERRYHLLEELHTLPSVGFLTKVWNDEGEV